jgi:ABC-type Fe3+-siderophore transport system permease subunit
MSEENLPQKKDNQDDLGLPDEVTEALESLPPEARRVMQSLSFQGSFPVFSPIQKKITEQHITKVLDLADKDSQRKLDEIKSTETTKRLAIGAVLVLVIAVLIYSGITKETLLSQQIIGVVMGALGGAGVVTVFRNKS